MTSCRLKWRHNSRFNLLKAITAAKDNDGRQIASIFFVKPNPEQYPDYYEVIREPIDLKTIDMKITKSNYKSIDDMMADVFLMFKNAKQYNEPNSLVYQDAVLLETLARQKVSELCQKAWGDIFQKL